MTGWNDVDITDWHWFAERHKLDEFEEPKELKAKVKGSQKKKLRENRQSRNATKRKAIEADVEFVPAAVADVQHLVRVGAAHARVHRACDKLGRCDELTQALHLTLDEICRDLHEGKLTAWAAWWLRASERQRLLRVDDRLRARRERGRRHAGPSGEGLRATFVRLLFASGPRNRRQATTLGYRLPTSPTELRYFTTRAPTCPQRA